MDAEANLAEQAEHHRYNVSDGARRRLRAYAQEWADFVSVEHDDREWRRFLVVVAPWERGPIGAFTPDVRARLRAGATVLDFGCGRGTSSVAMALMGARVIAVDVSPDTAELVGFLSEAFGLGDRLRGFSGDVRELDLPSLDLVYGNGVLHHLVPELERQVLTRFASALRPDGEALFVEPAHNSRAADALARWLPLPRYPSSLLQPRRYAAWKAADPHPERDDSSDHYRRLGASLFRRVEVEPYGMLESLATLLPGGRRSARLRDGALRAERLVPPAIRSRFSPSQRIRFGEPRA